MRFTGLVVHGKKLGRTIFFPTAKLLPTTPLICKMEYCSFVQHELEHYLGVMNIGSRPTVNKNNLPEWVQNPIQFNQLLDKSGGSLVINKQVSNKDIPV
jgi:FAD synthase